MPLSEEQRRNPDKEKRKDKKTLEETPLRIRSRASQSLTRRSSDIEAQTTL
jgi:hypothetical protein